MQIIFSHTLLTTTLLNQRRRVLFSEEFIQCAGIQLTGYFERVTELPVSRHIYFARAPNAGLQYCRGYVSSIKLLLFVNHHYNPVTVCWKSNTTRIYTPADVDIRCGEIEFWIDDLQADLYWRQHYPGISLPFQLPALSFQLLVNRVNIDCSFELYLRENYIQQAEVTRAKIETFLKTYNHNASKNKRKYTMLHHWKSCIEPRKIIIDIDLGFAGLKFIRKFLLHLSGQKIYNKVELW